MKIVRRFARDEEGASAVVDLILITSIVCLGAIVGLASFRDQAVQYFGDAAVALESLNQSYSFTVGTVTSKYVDPAPVVTDPVDAAPACIGIVDAITED